MPSTTNRRLTVQEAADQAVLDRSRIYRAIKRGVLRAERFGPGWVIRQADLDKFLALDRRAGRPPKPKKVVA